ncbi:MAG: PIN domain-containing protein [Pirellulales bacterium]|nr:PIN domain-containing protein [Pirellulales bacterium]
MAKKGRSHGLDTSVVLRLITGEPETLAARALLFIEEAIDARDSIIVSDIVICEAYFALNTHYDVPKREAIATLIDMLSEGYISTTDGSPILKVMRTCLKSSQKPGFVDRLIHAQYEADGTDMVSFEKSAGRLANTRIL